MGDVTVKKKAFLAKQLSVILHNNNALKYKDPGCPTISCFIVEHKIERALLDLGASVNLLPYSIFQILNLGELKPTSVTLLLADRSVKVPRGIVEDVLVQVDKFIYPMDFIVLDTQPVEACNSIPVILRRPFLATSNALINCRNELMKLSFGNMTLEMNVFNICKQSGDNNDLQEVDFIEKLVHDQFEIISSKIEFNESENLQMVYFQEESKASNWRPQIEELPPRSIESILSSVQPPKPDLKSLPFNLKYLFLRENETFPVIISSKLNAHQEGKLLQTLKMQKNALGWTIADIKGISPLICTHKIYLEENAKPSREMQQRLNLNMKEVVRNEVIKLLDNGIIYPISDGKWVSPTQVVPKKSGVTVITNEKNELIPTRTITSWRMCIDNRKLNSMTRKDHYPLPFMDQILERVAGHEFYCFLDGYSS